MKERSPKCMTNFERIARNMEKHYREMQDLEFTVEKGKLYMLQTRTGKRTARSAVKIAVDMVSQGLITQKGRDSTRWTRCTLCNCLAPRFDDNDKEASRPRAVTIWRRASMPHPALRRALRSLTPTQRQNGQKKAKPSFLCAMKPRRMMSTACMRPRGF